MDFSKAQTVKIFVSFLFFFLVSISSPYGELVDVEFSVKPLILEDYLKSSLPVNALWSLSAVDVRTGERMINAGNAKSSPLIPGSLVKLFTAAAVMDTHGRDTIELDTIIAYDGKIVNGILEGNLYIKGSGNAFLSTDDIEKAIDEIHSLGIWKISGDIIADESLIDIKGWQSKWEGPSYAPPSALGLNLHTISITLENATTKVTVDPPNDAVRIIFTHNGQSGIRQIDDFTYEVNGKGYDAPFLRKRFALKDPALFTVWTLKTIMRQKGIDHKGSIRRGETPMNSILLYNIKSRELADIIKDTNTYSLNVVSENLLFILGLKKYGKPGTVNKGLMALGTFLDNHGLHAEGQKFADGSGISSDNIITSEYIVRFLGKMSQRPWFETFYKSLPRAGIEGTLKNIGYSNQRVRAKTGHLDNVYSLAGYFNRSDGGMTAFSYMVNVPGADVMDINFTGATVLRQLSGETR